MDSGVGGPLESLSGNNILRCSDSTLSPFSEKYPKLKDGYGVISRREIYSLLYGDDSQNIPGYLNLKRISLDRLGLWPVVSIDDHPANFLYDYHYNHLDYYEDKTLALKNSETGEWITIKPSIRGTEKFKQKRMQKFKRIQYWASEKKVPIVHLRLSIKAPDGMSAVKALAFMRNIPNRLSSFLQENLPYRPKCIWVIEPTERGMCHYHMLFFGSEWLISKEKLDNWWLSQGLGNSSGVWIERLRGGSADSKKMIGYIIKYLINPTQDPYWSGLVSLMGVREYGISNRLMDMVKTWERHETERSEVEASRLTSTIKSNSKWICAGLLDKLLAESIIELNPMISMDELRDEIFSIRGSIKRLQENQWSRLAS